MDLNAEQITIVSGLPRSGTSVMMQMLAAGGLTPLSDEQRQADVDNPRGYFEFERAKFIKTDRTWLNDAQGRVVKLVHLLLLDLPVLPSSKYAVVFMRRDLDEVIRSQALMLQRMGKPAVLSAEQLKGMYTKQIQQVLAFLQTRPDVRLEQIEYADVVGQPSRTAARVAEFVGLALDADAMSRAVDPSLYRNRSK